ncbi:MAG: trehalose/maltose hydrolase or phosphorylase [Frankiales bacterium]|nr:trehalose/maltose hydrolase or phosphorylase [Frankiales bacterium]
MIDHECFPVEPWRLRETSLDLRNLAQTESLFALSNGHIGLRGNLDEGEPHGIPGTYLGGVHEVRPLPYAEAGYGYPEAGQSVVSVTNGKPIRLLVDDEPLDVRYGELHRHERVLDLRTGTLTRELEWTSPAGKGIRLKTVRLVSLTHRAVAAISYEVEAVDDDTRVVLQSELVANEKQPASSNDPRVAAALTNPLVAVSSDLDEAGAILLHRTRESGLLLGAGMDHIVDLPDDATLHQDVREDWARTTVALTLRAGQRLRIVKLLAYGWSAVRTEPAIRDQVAAALTSARNSGWEGLLQQQRAALDEFWSGADVEVEGDPALQQAVRFGLFHVLQASARTERRAIAAKGLTGPGYDGHAFWDTEGFVLPVLAATVPRAARDALLWRYTTLDKARERARTLGLKGAAFPWRTIAGDECSAYWPAGTAGFHINADIAYAVERYRAATADEEFDRTTGIELLVETARLWISLGHHDRHGTWHIDGVTGPDEYSAVADDNVFTNLMAARNLRAAAAACERHPQRGVDLGVDNEELEAWRDAAASVAVPYDEDLKVHAQSAGFTRYREFDASTASFPLLLHVPYVVLYATQVAKQADLLLAMHWCGDAFSAEDKARNVDYYERRTVRDSSLSACTQAVMCAEVGHLELAHAYATEAALIDLRDLQDNGRDGLHMASLAGAWTALVEGFGGLREHESRLCFDPALPSGITRLRFHLRWRGALLHTEVTHSQALFTAESDDITLYLADEEVFVPRGTTHTMRLTPRKAMLPPPPQPAGRAPRTPER